MHVENRVLYKSVIVIWTDYDPAVMWLEYLAREANVGDAYCSKLEIAAVKIDDLGNDPDWDGNEFFDLEAGGTFN